MQIPENMLDSLFSEQRNETLVFLYILSKSDDNGELETSMRAIAKAVGISDKTVAKILESFEGVRSYSAVTPQWKTKITIIDSDSYKVKFKTIPQSLRSSSAVERRKNKDIRKDVSTKTEVTANEEKRDTYINTLCGDNEEYRQFVGWLIRKAPYCFVNMEVPTYEELTKLKENYTGKQLAQVIDNIENRKDLRKRYSNLYRTTLNWAKKGYDID